MEKYLEENRPQASCSGPLFVDCMKNNADAFAMCGGGCSYGKYVIFLEREGHAQCDDAVDSMREADFIIESHAGNFDACWVEKCVGGEWVTVKIAKSGG